MESITFSYTCLVREHGKRLVLSKHDPVIQQILNNDL